MTAADTARPVCRCGHTAELHNLLRACESAGCACAHYHARQHATVPPPVRQVVEEFAAATGATVQAAARHRRNAARRDAARAARAIEEGLAS